MTCSINGIEEVSGLLPIDTHHKLTKLFPGKFTVLVKNTIKDSFPAVEGIKRLNKVGWRVPDNKFCLKLTQTFGRPISTTSANISGNQKITDPKEIGELLGDKVDLIIDSGLLKSKAGSTVLDFTKHPVLMVREGDVFLQQIKSILPKSEILPKKYIFKIVFICSGNICRSPMAEGVLKKMIAKTTYREIVEISSAGTLKLVHTPVHISAVNSAELKGVDIHEHVSRQVTPGIVEEADIIISMAADHVAYLQKKYPAYKQKFVLLKQWHSGKKLSNPSIADPIGHDVHFFDRTFNEIHKELKRVFLYIVKEIKLFIDYNDLTITKN